jgi:hypothetical protein
MDLCLVKDPSPYYGLGAIAIVQSSNGHWVHKSFAFYPQIIFKSRATCIKVTRVSRTHC